MSSPESSELHPVRKLELEEIESDALAEIVAELFELSCNFHHLKLAAENRAQTPPVTSLMLDARLNPDTTNNRFELSIGRQGPGFKAKFQGDASDPRSTEIIIIKDEEGYIIPNWPDGELSISEMTQIASAARNNIEREVNALNQA